VKTSCGNTMRRVLGAQEFTSRLKNKIVAKQVAPAPKYNYVSISKTANHATLGECCSGQLSNMLVVDLAGVGDEAGVCVCIPGVGCPGPETLPSLSGPTQTLTIQFTGGTVPFLPWIIIYSLSDEGFYDFTGTIATVNGTPVVPSLEGGGAFGLEGPFPSNSTVTYSFPTPFTNLIAVCFVPFGGG
jgi:hypothetical protein